VEALSFDDILLVPEHGVLGSRADADLTMELVQDYSLNIPLISANMPSVTNYVVAKEMDRLGAIGSIHRFQSVEDQMREFALSGCNAIVSFGTRDTDRLSILAGAGVRIFMLDVAHGDSDNVANAIWRFHRVLPDHLECKLIVGNIATQRAAHSLRENGIIDAFKVGIGPGAACVTREVTGFGVPQFSAIKLIREYLDNHGPHIKLIADGGCKNSGDIAKAFAAGADSVMIGRLLAGAKESPYPGQYFGNASKQVNGHNAPEGLSGEVAVEGTIEEIVKKLAWGLKSAVSYSGGRSLMDLRDVEYQRVTPLAAIESGVRF
jgi:IMP dehydrogenase